MQEYAVICICVGKIVKSKGSGNPVRESQSSDTGTEAPLILWAVKS